MASSFAADLFAQPEYKMVFVVNMGLDMGTGKKCAQVAHAAVSLFAEIETSNNMDNIVKNRIWFSGGAKKIVCKGDNMAHLLRIQQEARAANIPNYLVSDAGHTQIPAGSVTVLGLFGSNQELDRITGSLRLL